jgi:molecular chaperone IbpA
MTSTLDFSPLFRSGIGFDHLFDLLENANHVTAAGNWPPYDIAKTGEDAYRITMAVAGFGQEELSITQQPHLLMVAGQKTQDDQTRYLHRGLAGRAFERRFELADHVKVKSAALENGLLTIDLEREIPEEMKPRRIEIGSTNAKAGPRLQSQNSQAA